MRNIFNNNISEYVSYIFFFVRVTFLVSHLQKKQQINEASNKAVNMIPFIPNCDYVDEKEIMFNIGILAKSLRQERAINSTRRENR